MNVYDRLLNLDIKSNKIENDLVKYIIKYRLLVTLNQQFWMSPIIYYSNKILFTIGKICLIYIALKKLLLEIYKLFKYFDFKIP